MPVAHTNWRPNAEFIKVYERNLDEELCHSIIERFELDDRKTPGVTGGGLLPEVKDSMDLMITNRSEWADIDSALHEALNKPAQDMFAMLQEYANAVCNPRDTGYQIQRTLPGGGYAWHNDSCVYDDFYERVFTYIWYLNTVEEGGETEFLDTKIKPVVGKLVLFPATWTFLHRGLPPARGRKYICTGWMLSEDPNRVNRRNRDK